MDTKDTRATTYMIEGNNLYFLNQFMKTKLILQRFSNIKIVQFNILKPHSYIHQNKTCKPLNSPYFSKEIK